MMVAPLSMKLRPNSWTKFAAPRFSLFYAVLFLQVGIALPFFPVVLAGRGLSATALGLVLAAIAAARTVTIPFLGYISDRYRLWRGFLLAVGLIAMLGLAAFGFVWGFWPCLALAIVVGPLYPALTPIVDAHALRGAHAQGGDFGRVRVWGSVAFLGANVVGGALIGRLGQDSILTIIVALTALGALSAFILPGGVHGEPSETQRIDFRAARELLASRRFLAILLIAGGIQTSHAVLYGFGTLIWRGQGMGESVIGILWAIGVCSEVVLFSFSQRLVRRVAPARLLALGALGGVVRWGALAFAPGLPFLFGLQLLHAASFGLTFIAAIHLVQEAVPARLAATAQALYAAASGGIFFSVLTACAGPLYAHFGSGVYVVPALLSGLCALSALLVFVHKKDRPALTPIEPAPEMP